MVTCQNKRATHKRSGRSLWEIILLLGCGNLRTLNPENVQYIVEPQGNSLFLQIMAADGTPVAMANVSGGGRSYISNAAGQVVLEEVEAGESTMVVTADGFAPSRLQIELREGAHVGTVIQLLPLTQARKVEIVPDQPTRIQEGSVCLTIPPASLVQGLTGVVGVVDIRIVSVARELLPRVMPGPLQGKQKAEPTSELRNFTTQGMTYFQLTKNGQAVDLGPGKTATLEIVLPADLAEKVKVGDSIPMWWIGRDYQQWLQAKPATVIADSLCKVGGSVGKLVLSVEIDDFAWWSSGFPWAESSCVAVKLNDHEQVPAADVQVTVEMTTEPTEIAQVSSFTTETGATCLAIPADKQNEILIGPWGQRFGEGQTIEASKASASCGNPSACEQVQQMLPAVTPRVCTPGALLTCLSEDEEMNAQLQNLRPNEAKCQENTFLCNASGTAWLDCANQLLPTEELCTPT